MDSAPNSSPNFNTNFNPNFNTNHNPHHNLDPKDFDSTREKWIIVIDAADTTFVKEYVQYNDIHFDDDFPFIYAITMNKLDTALVLWDAGADPRATNEFEESALELTIKKPNFIEISKKIRDL